MFFWVTPIFWDAIVPPDAFAGRLDGVFGSARRGAWLEIRVRLGEDLCHRAGAAQPDVDAPDADRQLRRYLEELQPDLPDARPRKLRACQRVCAQVAH